MTTQLEKDIQRIGEIDTQIYILEEEREFLRRAVKYGRCFNCKEPLMNNDSEVCEDCELLENA